MIQLTNQKVYIHAKLCENQYFTLNFNAHPSDQISEVIEKGFEGFRQKLSQEIFLPNNKALFLLTNEAGQNYNEIESVEEGLEIQNNICLVYFKLKNDFGQKDNVKLRINHLRELIQGLETKTQLLYFDLEKEKDFKIDICDQKELGEVQFKFMCQGNEQTIFQLKKKALDLFILNFPNLEILVEYDYFTLKNNNQEYGINENNELVSFLFKADSDIKLQLCLKGPIDANLLQKQFGNVFYKFISIGHDIQYVFHQFYKFIQESGESINSEQILEIEYKIIETSVEECQLLDQVKQQQCDIIREFARSAVNFAKRVSKTKLVINSAPYVVGGGILSILYSNLKFFNIMKENGMQSLQVSNGLKTHQDSIIQQINGLSTNFGYIIGAISLAAEIGYLIYHRKKFKNEMFYKRICSAVAKQVTGLVVFKYGIAAVATLAAPTLMVSIIGVILGVGLAFISQYIFEKILNYFWGSDKQMVTDINSLNDHDKNKCYFSALNEIDCDEMTPTNEIKKLRLQRLKELHPDKQNDSNKKEEFIKQYVAFEIVLSFRYSQQKN